MTSFIPATDPYMAAYYIKELVSNLDLNRRIGKNAKTIAEKRHCIDDIVSGTIDMYSLICK